MDGYEEVTIHYNTESLVCPYCSWFYYDCTDIIEEEGEETCVNCGETFTYRKNIFITWDSDKKEI